jgi:ABC-type sugar transport system substrate-binding protein
MANIHVLTGTMLSKRKVSKSYAFHFTIPIDDRVAEAAQDPDLVAFVSVVPDITQAELDAIKAGEVVETVIWIPYNRTATNAQIAGKVQAEYTATENFVRLEYIERYRQYLTTL